MTDRWVNAVVEMRVPLYGVDPDGDDGAKMDAAVAWFDALLESAPVMASLACVVTYETVVDGEVESR